MIAVVQIVIVSIAAVFCTAVLKKYVPELSLALSLAAASMLLFLVTGSLAEVLDYAKELAKTAGISDTIFQPTVKVIGMAVVTRIAAQICRDAGEGSVAVCCELCGTIAAVSVALPLLEQVLVLVSGFLAGG